MNEQQIEEFVRRLEQAAERVAEAMEPRSQPATVESVARNLSSDIDLRQIARSVEEIVNILREQQATQTGRVRT